MTARIIPFPVPNCKFLEVIFRLSGGVAMILHVPRESVAVARVGDVFPIVHDGVEFEARIIAMRPIREEFVDVSE